ncbi:MAG: hypothetical protein Q4P20_06350 [Eubacteriales bacterium]|nr:hypothetical protein [Eubacteriales bacterium]
MKRLNKLVVIVTKVLEVMHWLTAAVMAVVAVAAVAAPQKVIDLIQSGMDNGSLTVQGFEIAVQDSAGNAIGGALLLVGIAGIITCGLMAMVFRNIYLIFRTTSGETWFSKGKTPFQPDNIRMVREIGIFCISIPVIQLVFSIIGGVLFGVETVVSMNGLMLGIIVLCLSQFFAYGTQLQEDVDGLV